MVDLITQPWDGDRRQVGDVIKKELETRSYTRFVAVTAFATRSGVRHLLQDIQTLKSSGGSAEIFVGIDGRTTTVEALSTLLEANIPTWVLHNTTKTPRTIFHPKMYLLEGADRSLVLIGSTNLTAGGLYNNYELNACLTLSVRRQRDRRFKASIDQFLGDIRRSANCAPLSRDLLKRLRNAGLRSETEDEEATEEERHWHQSLADIFAATPVPPAPPLPVARSSDPRSASGAPKRANVETEVMVIDVNPENARIYFDGHMYVGSLNHVVKPQNLAPYFTKECGVSAEVPEVMEDGVTWISDVVTSEDVPTSDVKRGAAAVGNRVTFPGGAAWQRWQTGLEAIKGRALKEGWTSAKSRLYFLSEPRELGRTVKKGPKQREFRWGLKSTITDLMNKPDLRKT